MSRKNSYITVTDQFCGAGGSSQGVRRLANKHNGGLEVKIALFTFSKPALEDCYYRMIKPKEVKLAMAFDYDYVVLGSGKYQVRQLGNAITPPAMEWLVQQVVQSLN